MKKNRYETPQMETVKIRTRMILAYSDTQTLQKYGGTDDSEGIDNEDYLL